MAIIARSLTVLALLCAACSSGRLTSHDAATGHPDALTPNDSGQQGGTDASGNTPGVDIPVTPPGVDAGQPPEPDMPAPGDVASGNDVSPDRTVTCAVPDRCMVPFSYPHGMEEGVELFGDFNNWQVGIPMQLVGSTWQVSIPATNGHMIQYKFVLDGWQWVNDPNNPNTTMDASHNSVVTATCMK